MRKVQRREVLVSEIPGNQAESCKALCYLSISETNELINTFRALFILHAVCTNMTSVKECA